MSADKQSIDIYNVQLLRLSNKVWFGCGAINKINDILEEMKERKMNRVMIVTGKSSFKQCWPTVEAALKANQMEYVLFDKVQPNPLEETCKEAIKIALDFGAQFFISIGGGSVTDSAKCIATMCCYPKNEVYQLYTKREGFPKDPKFFKTLPLIVINTTHGTGSEADRWSVVSFPDKEQKLGTGHENMYPMYSIDDPCLLKNLPLNQTLYTAIDALNHANECCTGTDKSLYTIALAREVIRLVLQWLPVAVKDLHNEEARYYLTYAALIAGTGIDNARCHATHVLEHVLSVLIQDMPHGLGLAMLLPAVQQEMYPKVWKLLLDVWAPIIDESEKAFFTGKPENLENEAKRFAKIIEEWIFKMGVTNKLGDYPVYVQNLDKMVLMGLNTLRKNSPLEETEEEVRRIYKNSMKPLP